MLSNTLYVAPAMIDLFVSIMNSGFSIDCDTKMAVSLSPTRKFHKSFKALPCLCYTKNKTFGAWLQC